MINKALLTFLKNLEKNNNKPWFEENKPKFQTLDKEFKSQADEIMQLLNEHDVIEKAKTYRIYRDVRFSKDKTPYKAHRSVNWIRAGADRRGGYYMRIKSGECLIGVGFFAPEKDDLLRVRKELEVDAQEMRDIIEHKTFKNIWGNNQGDQLKTAPRNFDKTHPDIDLMRYKSFFFIKNFKESEVHQKDFFKKVNDAFKASRPFLDYMTDVLTTDLNGESLL